jgi:hypothetical protein
MGLATPRRRSTSKDRTGKDRREAHGANWMFLVGQVIFDASFPCCSEIRWCVGSVIGGIQDLVVFASKSS